MSDTDYLKKALGEFADSLTRQDAEKDHQAAIVAAVKEQCHVEPAHFKRLAAAMHKDKLEDVYLDAGEFIGLVDAIRAA